MRELHTYIIEFCNGEIFYGRTVQSEDWIKNACAQTNATFLAYY